MGFKGALRFFLRRAAEILVFILLVTFLPNLPPHVNIQKSYTVTPPKPFEGKLALNERLNNAEVWHKGDLQGPEAFVDFNGELYTSLNGGDIVKLTGEHITPIAKFGKPCKGLYQERICGRPLGMAFTKDGSLFVCDAYYGVFKVDIKTGDKVMLVSSDAEINGKKVELPNSLTVASNGDIYWSDSSTQFGLEDGIFDLLTDGSGRLIHYNAKTKQNKVLLDGLLFANGVALSDDEEFIVISETGRSRLQRCFLKGPKQGKCEIFIDGLPGMPDNLKVDGQGGFFVPLIVAVDKDHPVITQVLGPFPLIRKFLIRTLGLIEYSFKLVNRVYPNEYAEKAVHFIGHFHSLNFAYSKHRVTILQVSKNGEIIDSFHALDAKISSISEIHVFKDYAYLGSPFNDYIARVPLSKIGLKPPVTKQAQQQTKPPTAKQTQPPTAKQTQPPTQVPVTPKPSTAAPKIPSTTSQTPHTTTQAPPIVKQNQPPKEPVTQKQEQKPTVAPKTVTPQKPVAPVKEVPVQAKQAPPPSKVNEVPVQAKQPPPPSKVNEVPVQAKQVKDSPTLAKEAPSSPQVKEVPVQAKQAKDTPPTASPKTNEAPVQAKPGKDVPPLVEKKEIPPPVKEFATPVPKQDNSKPIDSKPTPASDRSEIKKDSPSVASTKKDNPNVASAKGTT